MLHSTRASFWRFPAYLLGSQVVALAVFMLFSPSGRAADETYRASTGEWGTIESYEIVLEPPRSQLWSGLYSERSVWNFNELKQEEVMELFHTFEFSPELIALIEAQGIWEFTAAGTELEITDEIVEAMTSENRTAIAAWLRKYNNKFFSKLLINFEGHSLDILRERITPEQFNLVESVAFNRGEVKSIIDRPYLLRQVGTDVDVKQDLVQALFSTHSLIVRLKVDENSDIDSMVRYWSRDGKNPRVRSILNGVQSTEGVDYVDIIQLLPPFPRKYLFGFAKVDDVYPQNAPDCFWTAIHFFRAAASPRMLDTLTINHYLDSDFTEVTGEPTYGDIVCLFKEEDESFVHSYVHIADDIVFTKNGSSFARPWILTRKERMMSVYVEGDKFLTLTFRPK